MSATMLDHGLMTFTSPDADRPILEVKTLCCCHCGAHFPANPSMAADVFGPEEAKKRQAAGRTVRGFCMNCNGPVCGPDCAECVPVEQYLENMEHGRDELFKPAFSSLSGATMWLPPSAV